MNQAALKRSINAIAAIDTDIEQALAIVGYPAPRNRPAGFETLVNIIVSQQLSVSSAKAIMQRVRECLPNMTAQAATKIQKRTLRKAGLSEKKAEYVKHLAKEITSGKFDVNQLQNTDDQTALAAITQLHGFGVWSAEIYLMFSLDRRDIFPAGDLALQLALQKLKVLQNKPTPEMARDLVMHWSPHRSAGSLFLWHYYKGMPV
jgi:DNA-3-methyladenine glycosylase II